MGAEIAGIARPALVAVRQRRPNRCAQHILNVVRAIRRRQVAHRRRDLLHASLYGNTPMLGFSPSSHTRVVDDEYDQLVLNLIKPKVDTWVSMICRSRPEPMFLPTGADPTEMVVACAKASGARASSDGRRASSSE